MSLPTEPTPIEGPAFTLEEAEEAEDARRLARDTPYSLDESLYVVARCRGVQGVTAQQVLTRARYHTETVDAAFNGLVELEKRATEMLNDPIQPHERAAPEKQPTPAPPKGNTIHLREPTSKAEKRMAAVLVREFKARNRALKELVRCNRAIEKAMAECEKAGMVNGVSKAGQPAPAPALPGKGA